MKKIISILLILCVIGAVFAADNTVVFNGLTAIDSRSPAMGGSHVADTSDYFTLLRNPAGLAFSGRHNLIGQTNITIGGPLEEALGMVTSGFDESQLMSTAMGLISQNKLNLGINLGGPIAFGGTYKNGFGWGLFEQVVVGMVAPSTTVKINLELDADLVFGYGHKFDLGEYGTLAAGISTDIYGQVPYLKAQKNLLTMLPAIAGGGDMTDALLSGINCCSTSGVNVNAGLQYEVLDFLSAGLVWNNFFNYTKKTPNLDDIFDNLDPAALLAFSESSTSVATGSLDLGVGFDIPTFWSLGIISDWTAYADMRDLVQLFKNDATKRNPMLNLGIGTELTLLKCISARLGINDSYLTAGIGLRLLGIHIDASLYGKELGVEPGATPQLNASVAIGIRH
ncbi:MAG: hypothetical protein KBT02_13570 [Treponema sp.]|nr:hypothetical protein [Candidatus Treponema caballi]